MTTPISLTDEQLAKLQLGSTLVAVPMMLQPERLQRGDLEVFRWHPPDAEYNAAYDIWYPSSEWCVDVKVAESGAAGMLEMCPIAKVGRELQFVGPAPDEPGCTAELKWQTGYHGEGWHWVSTPHRYEIGPLGLHKTICTDIDVKPMAGVTVDEAAEAGCGFKEFNITYPYSQETWVWLLRHQSCKK